MKNVKQYWPYAVIGILLIVILLFIFRKVPLPGEDPLYEHLQHQNDSLLELDAKKTDRLLMFEKSDDSLKSIIQNNNDRIQKIYIEVEKRVAVYDTFTLEQLDSIITKRYP